MDKNSGTVAGRGEREHDLEIMLRYALEGCCAVCGWPIAKSANEGCVQGNCSMRPQDSPFRNTWLRRAKLAAALATPSPQAPQCCCNASWLDLDQRDCPIHGPAATQEQPAGSAGWTPSAKDHMDLKEKFNAHIPATDRNHKGPATLDRISGSPRKVGEDGALREALVKAEATLDLAIAMHDKAGCSGETCSYPYDLQKTVRTACRAALSLSSPTEPDNWQGCRAKGGLSDSTGTPQAEIREALAKWQDLRDKKVLWCYGAAAMLEDFEAALASRQGAGGK